MVMILHGDGAVAWKFVGKTLSIPKLWGDSLFNKKIIRNFTPEIQT